MQRKGKIIRIILSSVENHDDDANTDVSHHTYLYMHMGMTGRISTPHQAIPTLKSLEKSTSITEVTSVGETQSTYPPPHTHVILTATHNQYQVAFSDPRRFGGISLVRIKTSTHNNDNNIQEMTVSSSLHQQWLEFAPDLLEGCSISPTNTKESHDDPYTQLIGKSNNINIIQVIKYYNHQICFQPMTILLIVLPQARDIPPYHLPPMSLNP